MPIENPLGVLVGYCGVAVKKKQTPFYRFPDKFRHGVELYNLHRALADSQHVQIVPTILDVWRAFEDGNPHVVAVLGSQITAIQLRRLIAFEVLAEFPVEAWSKVLDEGDGL